MERTKDRTDPAFWEHARKAYFNYAAEVLHEYRRYCKWYAGDMDDIVSAIRDHHGIEGVVESNMINLAARMSRAALLFRAPRFVVKPAKVVGPSIFSPAMARVESLLLNDLVQEVDLFGLGRRVILDMLLGPIGVFKVGYSAEIGVNPQLVDTQRRHAQQENLAILAGGTPRAKLERDVPQIHREEHDAFLAAIQRGDIEAPSSVVAYLVKHIGKHDEHEKKYGGRPTETIRREHVSIRRVSPLSFFYDPWAQDASEREWVGEAVIRTLDEVRADERYDKKARMEVESFKFSTLDDMGGDVERFSEMDEYADHCLVYEIIDLVEGQVITYARGAERPLRVVPYVLRDILPSGPYIDASFSENPLTDLGVPPPKVYEGHQTTLTLLESIQAMTAERAIPKMAAVASAFTTEELEKIRSGTPALLVVLERLQPGQKIQDVLQNMPTPEISQVTPFIAERQIRAIERYSGLGSAKMAGGDFSKTATASAIVAESTGSLSEDLSSVLDDMLSRLGRACLRLMRRFYTPQTVAELVGEFALQYWPQTEQWTNRDIVNDRGVEVVPGSTQRKNTAVEQKMLLEAYSVLVQNPILPPQVHVELLARLLDSMGIYGIDLEGVEQQLLIQQMEAQMQQAEGQQQGADPAERTQRRAEDGSEPSNTSRATGSANAGGGRVPTGASKGDNDRVNR